MLVLVLVVLVVLVLVLVLRQRQVLTDGGWHPEALATWAMASTARRAWVTPDVPLPPAWPTLTKAAILHVIGLAHFAAIQVQGWALNSPIARRRLAAENEQLRAEVGMLREELRIKDARFGRISARERPHYAPSERLAILALRAARAWSMAQLAERFLVSAATIATWSRRATDAHDGLVAPPAPVNKFPDVVEHVVQALKHLVPSMGKVRIAQMLARAGLHLGATTVKRMLERQKVPTTPLPPRGEPRRPCERTVTAKRPHHVWNIDLTEVPTAGGRGTTWWPWRLPNQAPFSWWVVGVLDHFSRRVVGFAVFSRVPSAADVVAVMDRAVVRIGRTPKYTVTDQGVHFRGEFRDWCARRGVEPRFGAVGGHGSIAVIERFFRSLKDECLRPTIVPLRLDALCAQIARWCRWYDEERPHQGLGGMTPIEMSESKRRVSASRGPRFEPRARYPVKSPCARPQAKVRGRRGAQLELVVDGFEAGDVKHLPVVSLRRAA